MFSIALQFDIYLFRAVNNLAGRSAGLDAFGLFCAEYLIVLLAVIFLAVVLTFWLKNKKEGKFLFWAGALSALAAYSLKTLINIIYFRPRPFVALEEVQQILEMSSRPSFPSGHTILAFALAFSIFFFRRRLGAALLALALFVGVGRIYVGVHYPSDILGGLVIAFAVVFAVFKLKQKINLFRTSLRNSVSK